MSKRIKGITIELDGETKGLDKSLGDVNKRSRDTAKELRDVERLLKFNPKNTELLAQKQKLLGDQVNTTKEKLDQLKGAQAEVQRQFEAGEIGEDKYRAFQREIVETESKLKHFEGQLEQTKTKWESFSDKAVESGEKMKKVGGNIKDVGGDMTKWVTGPLVAGAGGLIALSKASGDAADRILDLSEITGLSTDSIQEWQHVSTVAGVETEALTGAVEGLVRRIPQLESEGGKASEALEGLGVTYEDLSKLSPDEQVDTLMNKLSEMEDPLKRNAAGSQLFGGAWKEIAPILGMGADEIAKTREEAHDLGVVLSEDSLNDANDFRVEMDKLMATLKGVFLQIGADLAPMLRDTLGPLIQDTIVPAIQSFADKVKTLIEWFADLSPNMQKTILVIVGIAAALGPVLVVVGFFISTIGTLLTLLPLLGTAFTIATGPIGLIVAAIAGLVAIGVLLWKNWDMIKEKSIEIWTNIAEFFVGLFEGIKNIFNNALDWIDDKTNGKFKAITDGIRNYMKMVVDNIKAVWDFVKNTFKNATAFLKSLVTGDFKGMKDAIKNQMDNAKNLVSNILDNIKGFFTNTFGFILSTTKEKFNSVKDAIMKPINSAKDLVKKAIDSIKGFFSGMNLKFPKIKMPKLPRFSLKGKFSLAPPSVPKLDIKWNAKGGIFNQPTIFNTANAGLQGVGEAGPEAILPLNSKVLGDIGKGIAATMTGKNQQVIIQPAPIYLDGQHIADVTFNAIDERFANQSEMQSYMRGDKT